MIGVAIPSRGRPKELQRSLESLRDNSTEKLWIVVRLDWCDPSGKQYIKINRNYNFFQWGERGSGYADNWKFINEAAEHCQGDLLMQFVDDAEMRTDRWNEVYREAIGDRKIFVCSANVTTPDGSNYPWSFPLIPRRLYEINGAFCLGNNPSVDRCWHAFARHYNCEVTTQVDIIHHHIGAIGPGDQTSQEGRTPFARSIGDWAHFSSEHDRIGREFAEKVKAHLENHGL